VPEIQIYYNFAVFCRWILFPDVKNFVSTTGVVINRDKMIILKWYFADFMHLILLRQLLNGKYLHCRVAVAWDRNPINFETWNDVTGNHGYCEQRSKCQYITLSLALQLINCVMQTVCLLATAPSLLNPSVHLRNMKLTLRLAGHFSRSLVSLYRNITRLFLESANFQCYLYKQCFP
jgi:hypothetical protein